VNILFSQLTNRKIFWLCFAFYSMLGVVIVYCLGPVLHLSGTMGGKPHDGFLELAANVVSGNGYVFEPDGDTVIHRPPAYVVSLIPGMYLPDCVKRIYVIMLNSALAAGAAVVIKKFALSITSNKWIAVLSVALFVGNPWIIWSVKNPMSVIFQMFFYLLISYLALLIFQTKVKRNRWTCFFYAGMLGIVCGIASLSHGIMLPISIIVLTTLAFCVLKNREIIKLSALSLSFLAMCCVILPWTLRNYEVTGRFIPVVGNSGATYFGGNAYWGITKPPAIKGENIFEATLRHAGVSLPYEAVFHFWGIKDGSVEKQINDAMVTHLTSNTLQFGKKIILNALGYYFPIAHSLIIPSTYEKYKHIEKNTLYDEGKTEAWFISIYYGVLLILAFLSVVFAKNSCVGRRGAAALVVLICLYAFPYFPFLTFVGHSQYVFGTLPFLYILVSNYCVSTYISIYGRRNEQY
jgi:hypothetical protein